MCDSRRMCVRQRRRQLPDNPAHRFIRQRSPPAELYVAPVISCVAQFIGEKSRWPGKVTKASNGVCHVALSDGSNVQALPINLAAGAAMTTLSIRPERVEVDPTSPEISNRVTGVVNDIIYLGDHLRARLTAGGSDNFVVKAPNRDGQRRLEKGQSVTLGWRTKDCRALDPL